MADELEVVPGHRDYLSIIFRRCVFALAGARVDENTVFERRMAEQLVTLAEEYLTDLGVHLQRISHMQRRTTPSTGDVALLLHFHELNIVDLIQEAKLTPQIEESHPVSTLNALYFDPEIAPLIPEQMPFFAKPRQLSGVATPGAEKPRYIPRWLPDLPPKHTYRNSASHSSQIRDLRAVRMSLVEEGRQAERALQRLLGDRGSSSVIELPKYGEKPKSKSIVVVDQNNKELSDEAGPRGLESTDGDMVTESAVPATEKSEQPKKLSLKLSLGKTKKRRDSIFGKRPKIDIMQLARRPKEQPKKKEENVDPFTAAIESYRRESQARRT